MGFYDELEDAEEARAELQLTERRASLPQMTGLRLLQSERTTSSPHLITWGALGARLEAAGTPVRQAWALLNMDRVMRRSLASARIDPADVLPCLLGGKDPPALLADELRTARFLLSAVLPVIAVITSTEGQIAGRLLRQLRTLKFDRRDTEFWDDERDVKDLFVIIRDLVLWFSTRMSTCDPMFSISDVLAAFGAALNGFSPDHLPDDENADAAASVLESYRRASSLPPLLSRLREVAPEEGLLTVLDTAAGVALVHRLPPAPYISGLIRRDLFRRDLHYPADLGSLYSALQVSLAAAERDRLLVMKWHEDRQVTGRVQLLALAALSCFSNMRISALARITGTTWQGMQAALLRLNGSHVQRLYDGSWQLAGKPS